jgi:ribose/xylose/arabinose/galactoside ABC-type transport system permease subunit
MGFELDVIAAVVLGGTSILGGRGTVIGSLLGALLVGIIKNGMILLNVPALSEGLVIGVLIIVSVLLDLLRSKR